MRKKSSGILSNSEGFCKSFFSVLCKLSLKLYVSILMLPILPLKCEKTSSSRLLASFSLLLVHCLSFKGVYLRLFQYMYPIWNGDFKM